MVGGNAEIGYSWERGNFALLSTPDTEGLRGRAAQLWELFCERV